MTIGLTSPTHYQVGESIYAHVDKPRAHAHVDAPYDRLHASRPVDQNVYGMASASAIAAPSSDYKQVCVRGSDQERLQLSGGDVVEGDFASISIDVIAEARSEFLASSVCKSWLNPLDGRRGVPMTQFASDVAKAITDEHPAGLGRLVAPKFSYGAGKGLHLAVQCIHHKKYPDMLKTLAGDAAEANRLFGIAPERALEEVLSQALSQAFQRLPQDRKDKWTKRVTNENAQACSDTLKLSRYRASHPGPAILKGLVSVADGAR
ncbi:hypothetical protein [Roseateles sp. L2-2]|uniref:hypothetical protein n=1 Tax=Roseateles sp. L2-2 TaxID=3422597 RepID=UPI003D36C92E